MTIAVLGEALIDLIAGRDGTYSPHLGGSPYNVAIGLARQGGAVSYLSPFSSDAFGDRLRASLSDEGVRLPVERRADWPTSLAVVVVGEGGSPCYSLYREGVADKDWSVEEVVACLPDDLTIFHTGSLAITPDQLPGILQLIEVLRDRHVAISVDLNVRLRASPNTQAYLDGVKSLLPLADIVKCSDEDLAPLALAEQPSRAASLAFAEMGSGLMLFTQGSGGAQLLTGQGVIEQPGYPVEKLVDTVGAGDTFHSAFLASLVRAGADLRPPLQIDSVVLRRALAFACAAAALNVSRAGCSPPSAKEVEQLIAAARS